MSKKAKHHEQPRTAKAARSKPTPPMRPLNTHNPNIVVSGDAEQVVVLNAISDRRAEVDIHGSIDNEDIVESVIDIMEGGREAFLVRKKRYGI